jgi:hypothetical protein
MDAMMPGPSHISTEFADSRKHRLPFSPSFVFLEGVVESLVPSPGVATSNSSIASSNPQYSLLL